jgi:hypothetical protein
LQLSWEALAAGQLAKSEYGYYLAYRNIDPESRVIRWYAKFEPRSGHFLVQEEWPFFDSLKEVQAFCQGHEQALLGCRTVIKKMDPGPRTARLWESFIREPESP